jgi:hypothetical protein
MQEYKGSDMASGLASQALPVADILYSELERKASIYFVVAGLVVAVQQVAEVVV